MSFTDALQTKYEQKSTKDGTEDSLTMCDTTTDADRVKISACDLDPGHNGLKCDLDLKSPESITMTSKSVIINGNTTNGFTGPDKGQGDVLDDLDPSDNNEVKVTLVKQEKKRSFDLIETDEDMESQPFRSKFSLLRFGNALGMIF